MDMAKPIIRFKGYQDDWEQRKLGDVVEDYVEKTTVEDQYPVLTSSQRKGIVLQDDFFAGDRVNQNGNIGYFIIPRGYFAFRSRSDNDVFVFNRNDAVDMGIISYFYPVFKPRGVDSDFLLRRLNYGLEDQIKINSEGTGQHVLSLKKFKNMIGLFPSYEEQKKIGSYFSQIDHLITLHQRKCDETKKLKKYMLQKMFPQNGEKVPEIRFSGFTDDWEQRKLEDIAEFSKGSGYSKGDLIESGTPIILYGRLYTKYETSISEVDTYVEAKDGSVYSKGGEVIVPASGETAEDIARAATVDKSGVILGGDLNVVSPNEDINSAFLAISISHGNSQRELAKKAQGKSVVHIHNEEIKNLVVPFPANAEQNKIVEYFSNLDHLITLHQRELENLQNIKKFMLGKMFV